MVVYAGATVAPKPGKLLFRGVVLEITNLAFDELADAQRVARTFYLAHCFARDSIIADPTGHLRELQRVVSKNFAEPSQVLKRCDSVFERIESGLRALNESAPWFDQILAWMFPTSLTAVAVIVAGGQNPTVRTRYLAAKKLLDPLAMSDVYEDLLELLGSRDVSAQIVRHHLDTFAPIFDAVASHRDTSFPFSADVSPIGRPIAIDGSRRLIDAGYHREAVFWILATFARCMKIFDAAGAIGPDAEFRDAVTDLVKINTISQLQRRREESLAFLPTLRSLVQTIIRIAES
jgi:hypothetical protein